MTSPEGTALRSRAYRLLALAFHGVPASETVAQAGELAAEARQGGETDVARALEALAAAPQGEAPGAIQQDFHDLFTVPGPKYVLPYGSVHADAAVAPAEGFDARPLNCGPHTVAVQRFYAAVGLQIDEGYTELPDYAGLELACMEYLLAREAEGVESGHLDGAERAHQARVGFVREHLDPWMGALLGRIQSKAGTAFHRHLASSVGLLLASEPRTASEA